MAAIKAVVLEITRLWSDSARDFFIHALDSEFAWRQRAEILSVYRLYVPMIGAEGQRLVKKSMTRPGSSSTAI